jgi:hypothetical protein
LGSRLPCKATLSPTAARARPRLHRPVQADHVGAAGGDLVQPQAAALGEDDAGTTLAVALALQAGHDAAGVGQAEAGTRRRPARRPSCRTPSRPARRRRSGRSGRRHRVRVDVQDAVHQVGPAYSMRLDQPVVVAAPPSTM